MASLPAHHPRLAIHLTDSALTPIISSSSTSPSSHPSPKTITAAASSSSSRQQKPTFSTSPLSSSSEDAYEDDDDDDDDDDDQDLPASAPLASLTHAALSSYATAKRLSRGAPLRTMIEYPHAGPVVLHSYLCPMSLALGTPGLGLRRGGGNSHNSLTTAVGGEKVADHDADAAEAQEPVAAAAAAAAAAARKDGTSRAGMQAVKGKDVTIAAGGRGEDDGVRREYDNDRDDNDNDDDDDDDDPDGHNAPPMLIATVVAPAAGDLKEARRAAGRLERIARSVQTEWVAEGPGT
ncbi:unnamed protein product [Discula destructiva]